MSLTESVYLDAVSADGRTAFVTRLARHVDEGVAWLWLHGFGEGFEVAFLRDDIELVAPATEEAATGACYSLDAGGVSARFERTGPAGAPREAHVTVRVPAHGIELDATFVASGPAGSNLPGRTEVLGRVDATMTTPAGANTLQALGQFHEQHQTAPRFQVPFTYGTLRGDDAGIVFLIGPRASGAFVNTPAGTATARQVRISPPGDDRELEADLEAGDTLRFRLERTHHYLLPINGHPRESSIVVAHGAGGELSGCVNDWTPPDWTPPDWTPPE